MAEINLTHEQLQKLLAEAMGAAVTAARKMNPLEQKAYDEELRKDRRRALLSVELGKIESEKRWRQQASCTHSRDKSTGDAVAKGTGQWTTGGQRHGHDRLSVICLRCGTAWIFKASPNELEYAEQHGLLGYAPPPVERCLNKEDFQKPVFPDESKLQRVAG